MGKTRKEAENEWDSAELTILSLMLMDADTATYPAAAMMESGVELQNEAIRSSAEELLIKYAGGENTSTAVMISELEPMQAEAVSAAEAQAEKIKGDQFIDFVLLWFLCFQNQPPLCKICVQTILKASAFLLFRSPC